MPNREIPHNEWPKFCRDFSRENHGAIVSIEYLPYDGDYRILTYQRSLEGISLDRQNRKPDRLRVNLRGVGSNHQPMILPALSTLRLECTPEGETKALEIHLRGTGMTIIRFHNPLRPLVLHLGSPAQ